MRAANLLLKCQRWIVPVLLLQSAPLTAQDPAQDKKFFEVKIDQDEVYSYENLQFSGDYTSFNSPSGHLVLGRTTAGVTLMIVLGAGEVTIDAPETAQEKFKTVFGACPLKTGFKSLYLRLNPKEYEESFAGQTLSKSTDASALASAKELYDNKFLGSYHAGPLAIFPPMKTRFMDFETAEFGQLVNEEGYWLILRRFSPYGSVYPSGFVNPKQK